jgi:hypothetical protein
MVELAPRADVLKVPMKSPAPWSRLLPTAAATSRGTVLFMDGGFAQM